MRADDMVGPWRRHELDRSIGTIDQTYALALGDDADTPLRVAVGIAAHGSLRALDVGCGTGNTLRTLAGAVLLHYPDAQLSLVGINDEDYSAQSMSARTRAAIGGQIQYDLGQAEQLPYDDASFNWVHSHEVMVHAPSPEAQLKEMVRVTAPGGHVFCQFNLQSVLSERQPLNKLLGRFARIGYDINEDALAGPTQRGKFEARVYLHLTAPS